MEEIDALTLSRSMGADNGPVVIDVREPYERILSYIPHSLHLPVPELERKIRESAPDISAEIVLYCNTGQRSLDACRRLQHMGYRHARLLTGGMTHWRALGLPLESDYNGDGHELSPRYARHLRIPEVGIDGQKKLLASRVLIVGAGGLGSPAAYYLTAAGIGTLGVVDFDNVDETNLHRQILFETHDIGKPKVYVAEETLRALNPDAHVVPIMERLTPYNAEDIVKDFDVVLDGADNFATRYLINDICLKLKKPNVHGSIHRFEGQVSVFGAENGPCYRCVYPEPPPSELVQSCAEAGVLGLLPGVIGTLQATEAVKLLLKIGDPLVGRMLHFDALGMVFTEFAVARRADCEWCDPSKEFPGLADYGRLCG
jgi:molybdopterin/thiamine biosynthesis adenylyltransferase/rhodanese-related sulfurtransferase